MIFCYRWFGYDRHGRLRQGRACSASRTFIIQRLLACGIAPVSCTISLISLTLPQWWVGLLHLRITRQRFSYAVVGEFCRDVASLLDAGVPLVKALRTVGQTTRALEAVLDDIYDQLHRGILFGDALLGQDRWPPVLCAAVQACQGTGRLAITLAQLGDAFVVKEGSYRQLRQALVVPLLTVVVGGGVLVGMVMFIIPMMGGISFSVPSWQWSLGGLALLGVGFSVLPASWRGSLLYRIPLVGSLCTLTHAIVTMQLLSVMLEAGQPLSQALRVVGDVPGNRYWSMQYQQLSVRLMQGVPLAPAITYLPVQVMPPLVRHCFVCATSQQRLAALCAYAAQRLNQRLEYLLTVRLALLQPLLMVIIGGGIAGCLYVGLGQVFASLSEMPGLS